MSDENELTEPERVSPSDTTVPNVPLPTRWPPAQQQFLRRDTFPLWATFLIIILAFALVGGGLSLIFFTTTAQYRSSLISQATTTTLLTAQARDRAQAQDQATAAVFSTANANIYATATAKAAVIAASTAIATAYGNIFINATTGTPALNDPLVDNSGNNYWNENGTVAGQCVFTGNAYHVLSAQQGYFQPCFAEASNFSNFVYQVAMIIDKGNQGGILLRANSADNAYYLFYIGIDGRYSLDIYQSGSKAATLTAGYSAAIVTGLKQTNQLAVIAFQGTLYLYANQQLITKLSNNTLNSGKIGVVALDFRNRTEVEFSNAQVWKITSSAFLNPTATPTATVTATATQTATATPTP